MKFEDVVRERHSCRSYDERPVKREVLDEILEEARIAPSASNTQRWAFICIDEAEKVKEISDAIHDAELGINVFAPEVPAYIAVVRNPMKKLSDRRKAIMGEDGSKWFDIDIGIATAQIALSATSRGLGNVIVGHFADEDAVNAALNLDDGMDVATLIAVGYEKEKKERKVIRKEKDEVIFYNTFK